MKTILLIAVLFFLHPLCAQSVVVSSYFNEADPRDEWTELLVVADNTDMRNWTIRDNNSGQTTWQTAATFTNNAFWNNMRAGTIIVIWHRPVASDGSTFHTTDVNKNDGYVELDLSNTTYFSGASLGSSPSWAGASMNIAGGGDVVELRDGSATHIHALGHISSPGANWTALPSPKLNHANNAASGDAVYVCPGNVIADYGTSSPQSGTTWTSKNSGTITFGLPNISGSSPIQNTAFWDTLREPVFASQMVAPSTVIPGSPGTIAFSWTGATDANPADGTTGYIVLRNTSNSFVAPADGTTYANGATLGTATVLTHIASSGTTTYSDNTVVNGNSYFYRVYAYRYTTDNTNGNTFHRARGRAYTSTFVDVQYATPLPVNLISFSAVSETEGVVLSWETRCETNNDYFEVQRASDNGVFVALDRVAGFGTTSESHHYSFIDYLPVEGNAYYRLRQTDYDGEYAYSNVVVVQSQSSSGAAISNAWINSTGVHYVLGNFTGPVTAEIFDQGGHLLQVAEQVDPAAGEIPFSPAINGIYIIRFSSDRNSVVFRLAPPMDR